MAFSENTFVYLGAAQVFETNFALGVLDSSHLSVTVDGVVDVFGDPVQYDFSYNHSTGEVTVITPLVINDVVRVKRNTPLATLITDFENGSDVTKRNLARGSKQTLMVVQEARDQREADTASLVAVVGTVDGIVAGLATDLATVAAGASAASASAAAAAVSKAAAEAASALAINAKENLADAWESTWLTATLYARGSLVRNAGSSYLCLVDHTSGVFATDLGDLKWDLVAQQGAAGAGTGDMLSSNNLLDVADPNASYTNIGGGAAGKKGFSSNTDLAVDGALVTDRATTKTAIDAAIAAIPIPTADLQIILSTGTWTKPTGATANTPVLVRLWAGGGGGGEEGGGGGGGYWEQWFKAGDLPATVAVGIGLGGTGSATSGTDGGNTTFSTYATAYGGQGASNNEWGDGGRTKTQGTSNSTLGTDWAGLEGWAGGRGGYISGGAAGDSTYGGAGGSGDAVGSLGGRSLFAGNGGDRRLPGVFPSGGGGSRSNGADGKAEIHTFL